MNHCKIILKYTLMAVCLFLLSSCYTSSRTSQFTSTDIKLGMTRNEFVKKFGEPFNQEMDYTKDGRKKEKLYFKEDLHKGSWFILTTAFTFIDSNLTKQEIVKEERLHKGCDCKE